MVKVKVKNKIINKIIFLNGKDEAKTIIHLKKIMNTTMFKIL